MTWSVDPAHTEITFAVKHMMVTTVRGRFANFEAAVTLDQAEPERSTVTASIDVASLSTGNADRDAHLRSADFFDVEHYPAMQFVSRRVTRVGPGAFQLIGDLTIRGVTQEVALHGEFQGPVAHLMGGRAVGVSLTGEVNREAFGLTWNAPIEAGGVLVGRTVKLAIDTEVIERAERNEAEQPAA